MVDCDFTITFSYKNCFITCAFPGKLPWLLDGSPEFLDHIWTHASENIQDGINESIHSHYIYLEKQSGTLCHHSWGFELSYRRGGKAFSALELTTVHAKILETWRTVRCTTNIRYEHLIHQPLRNEDSFIFRRKKKWRKQSGISDLPIGPTKESRMQTNLSTSFKAWTKQGWKNRRRLLSSIASRWNMDHSQSVAPVVHPIRLCCLPNSLMNVEFAGMVKVLQALL